MTYTIKCEEDDDSELPHVSYRKHNNYLKLNYILKVSNQNSYQNALMTNSCGVVNIHFLVSAT